ncbi:Mu transposase C-terminal domain-containing protein [Pseudomonadota bacterium]
MSTPLNYDVGSEVMLHDRMCVITGQVDIDEVLIRYQDDGRTEAVNIINLKAPDKTDTAKTKALDAYHEKDLEEARKRYDAIAPLLDIEGSRRPALLARAKELELHPATLYRWLQKFESVAHKTALAPRRRGKRKNRLNPKVEAIIRAVIETFDLSNQRHTQKRVIEEIQRRCRNARLKAPHANTICSRIKDTSAAERTKKRHGAKAARDKYGAAVGNFPNADTPLSYWQLDHTKLDLIIVDDEHREPIGRPWLTLAIDVHTRMIAGFYLALEAPSTFSVGMCLTHAILQKDAYLEKLGVKGSWPVWGFPQTLHVDNGRELRGKSIQKSLDEYNINLEWRPVKRPEFGGHIERVFGTLNQRIHSIKGTTFSNVKERGEYKSEKLAIMTFSELESWLANYFVNYYHQQPHSGINMPPIEKWRRGVLGHGKKKGIGYPKPASDPERLFIDFLPYEMRTVQRDGIAWDNVHYFANVLRPLIKAEKGGQTVKFLVRRDPRDIGQIYFLDPDVGEYFDIPYRHGKCRAVTLWEYRAAERELKRQGRESVDEEAVFEALDELQDIEDKALKATAKTRRRKQSRMNHAPAQQSNSDHDLRIVNDNTVAPMDDGEFELDEDDIKDDWEDWL